jgi:hypothetical protein
MNYTVESCMYYTTNALVDILKQKRHYLILLENCSSVWIRTRFRVREEIKQLEKIISYRRQPNKEPTI